MSSRRVLVVVVGTAAGGAEIAGARAVISRAAGIVVVYPIDWQLSWVGYVCCD